MKKVSFLILILSSFFFVENVNAEKYLWFNEYRELSSEHESLIENCFTKISQGNEDSFLALFKSNGNNSSLDSTAYVVFFNSSEYHPMFGNSYWFSLYDYEGNMIGNKELLQCIYYFNSNGDLTGSSYNSYFTQYSTPGSYSNFKKATDEGFNLISTKITHKSISSFEVSANADFKNVIDIPKFESGGSSMSIEELAPYLIAIGMCVLLVFLAVIFKR